MLLNYLKFITGGAVIAISELILTIILTEVFSIWYIYSYIIALAVGSLAQFFFHRHVSFTKHNAPKRRYIKFALFLGSIYTLNVAILYGLTRYVEYLIATYNLVNPIFRFHYAFSIPIVAIPFSMIHFFINKKYIFIFRDKKSIW